MNEDIMTEIENTYDELEKAILLIKNVQDNFDYILDMEEYKKYTENLYFKYIRCKKFLLKAQELLNNNICLFENLANNVAKMEDNYIDVLINGKLSVYGEEDEFGIVGSTTICINDTNDYYINTTKKIKWSLDGSGVKLQCATFKHMCKVFCSFDTNLIGKKVTLTALLDGEESYSKNIIIVASK